MTDVEAKTPKRKSLSGQDKKTPAKKAKLADIKTPQKSASPKGQNKNKQGNLQNSSQKFNKKNKRNSESENDSPKKLKPFPGTKSTNDSVDKTNKNENKSSGKRRRRSNQLDTLAVQIKSGDKQQALKTLETRINEIEGRGELSKSAKRKLKALKRLQDIAEGKPQVQPQVQKAPQNKSDLTKSQKKKIANKPPQNQAVSQKGGIVSSAAKINGKANKNAKVQNKPATKKPAPQKQVEEDEEESDSDEDEQDLQVEQNDSDEEEGEEESDEEGVEEGSGEESDDEEAGEEEEESDDDDDSDEEIAPAAKVQDIFDESASDEDQDSDEESDSNELETEEAEEEERSESSLDQESSLSVGVKRESDSIEERPNKKGKPQKLEANKNKVNAGETVNLEQLKKGNLVAKNQKRFVLFLGNIPYDTNKQDLIEHFKKSGEIKHIRIPTEKKSSKPRGFAYLELADEESYQKCLSMHHTVLKGRRINVLYTQGGKKKGEDRKKEIKSKNFKLHAMRKQGKLAGSVKQSQKRSFRRAKQNKVKVENEEQ